jgi:hypothetical protein
MIDPVVRALVTKMRLVGQIPPQHGCPGPPHSQVFWLPQTRFGPQPPLAQQGRFWEPHATQLPLAHTFVELVHMPPVQQICPWAPQRQTPATQLRLAPQAGELVQQA